MKNKTHLSMDSGQREHTGEHKDTDYKTTHLSMDVDKDTDYKTTHLSMDVVNTKIQIIKLPTFLWTWRTA